MGNEDSLISPNIIAEQDTGDSAKPSVIRIGLVGLLTCFLIGAIDVVVLGLAKNAEWEGPTVYIAFAILILQTALLGAFVGMQVSKNSFWLLFFGWVLVVVNLVLIIINLESNRYTKVYQSAFVFAFLTAQMGLAIFWGVLGSANWKFRLSLASALLLASSYPFWMFVGRSRGWLSVMLAYGVSVFLSCICLRYFRFRIDSEERWFEKSGSRRVDQFEIKHLFIWTTTVAFIVGVGRLVDWESLFLSVLKQNTLSLIMRSMMTLIIVAVAWTVLGEKRGAIVRLFVLFFALLAIGFGLYLTENPRAGVSYYSVGWVPKSALPRIWITWTTLNGLFLAGLLLAVRTAGRKLARLKEIDE